jgi:hypothetical protein
MVHIVDYPESPTMVELWQPSKLWFLLHIFYLTIALELKRSYFPLLMALIKIIMLHYKMEIYMKIYFYKNIAYFFQDRKEDASTS